jgi:diguanylate cyclase (GGDEF)-like protein
LLTETVFLIVTAVVGGLLVLGAALAAVRERAASRLAGESFDADWGKYEPDAELAAVEARGSAAASVGVVRVLWWVTIAAVLVGVGLSDSFRDQQATIFGLGGLAVIVVVVLHELIPRSWRNELTSAAEVGIAVALATGLLLLTGYGNSPYVFTLDLLAVAVALARGGWAAFGVAAIASAVYLGVIAADPASDKLAGSALLRIALNIGAVWLLAFLAGVFAAHERRVRHMLSDLSRIDPLTRLFNRGQIYPTLDQEVRRTRRSSRGFSVLMMDLDGLKAVNDSLGHQRGDEVLRSLGRTIRNSIRTVDSAYRYGGDEFLVLLPETDFSGAFVVAEKIRSDAEEMGYRLEAEGTSTSVSIGLVSHPEDGATADELVRAADRAMYNAKALGKNQISGYPRPPRLAGPPLATPPEEEPSPAQEPVPETPVRRLEPEMAPSFAEAASAEPMAAEPIFAESKGAEPDAAVVGSEPETVATTPEAEAMAGEQAEPPADEATEEAQSSEGFEERWVAPDGVRVNVPVGADHPDPEAEPDAEEVRRQIVVASRSFDPDHQIRRAMDAFLSPPGQRPGGPPD